VRVAVVDANVHYPIERTDLLTPATHRLVRVHVPETISTRFAATWRSGRT
jgi:hypothetical protein